MPNENWFLSPENAKEKVETCRRHYNGERPHSALGNLSAKEFAVLTEIGDWPAKPVLWQAREMGQDQGVSSTDLTTALEQGPDPEYLLRICGKAFYSLYLGTFLPLDGRTPTHSV